MNSYSKIFKASHLSMVKEVKVIMPSTRRFDLSNNVEDEKAGANQNESQQNHQHAQHIIHEAKVKAQEILAEAEQKAQFLKEAAEESIRQWWEENQQKLDELSIQSSHEGYREGFSQGQQAAEQEIEKQYEEKIQKVQQILEDAYHQKAEIIANAEPFLLELSTAIASQIIKQELEEVPEKFVELIQQHIHRFKEKESITVCVHPDDFDFIQRQQSHLVAVVNGETEIKIIPDHTVTPKGCIIRTAYGSIDARIDTQIEEIKKVLLEAVRGPSGEPLS